MGEWVNKMCLATLCVCRYICRYISTSKIVRYTTKQEDRCHNQGIFVTIKEEVVLNGIFIIEHYVDKEVGR